MSAKPRGSKRGKKGKKGKKAGKTGKKKGKKKGKTGKKRDLGSLLRVVPDFPKPGILFQDITPLWKDAAASREAVERIADRFADARIDVVVAPEARGFIIGAPVACALSAGFAPARKPGKLPWRTCSVEYALEYGTDSLCLHEDAVAPGSRVLVVDDLLATGGTVAALARLIEELDGEVVACAFLVELDFLKGREKLGQREIFTLVHVGG